MLYSGEADFERGPLGPRRPSRFVLNRQRRKKPLLARLVRGVLTVAVTYFAGAAVFGGTERVKVHGAPVDLLYPLSCFVWTR
jgi:hypothetical protein